MRGSQRRVASATSVIQITQKNCKSSSAAWIREHTYCVRGKWEFVFASIAGEGFDLSEHTSSTLDSHMDTFGAKIKLFSRNQIRQMECARRSFAFSFSFHSISFSCVLISSFLFGRLRSFGCAEIACNNNFIALYIRNLINFPLRHIALRRDAMEKH